MRIKLIAAILICLTSEFAIAADISVYLALSKEMSLLTNADVIANNVANVDTTGFKEQVLLERKYKVAHGNAKDSIYVKDFATFKRMEEGDLYNTNNPLDIAIQGEGFFIIDTEKGTRYSRAGNFVLNLQRQLVTASGDPVMSINGNPITFPENTTNVEIRQDGMIYIGADAINAIAIAQFGDYSLMANEGKNLLKRIDNATPDEQNNSKFRLAQGFLENSNVNKVKQLTLLMETQRDVSLVTSFISSCNEIDSQTINKLSKF